VAENYTAMNGSGNYYGEACLGIYDPSHPIMEGITQVCDYIRLYGATLTPGSTSVLTGRMARSSSPQRITKRW